MVTDGSEAGASATPRGESRPVKVRDIEDALTQLWMTNHSGGRSGMQAYVLNLIILGGEGIEPAEVQSVAAKVGATHPSRTIVVQLGADPEQRMQAWISAQCEYPAGGDQSGSELVTIEASGDAARQVPGTVIPLLIPEVPVVLWCPSDAALRHPIFPALMDAADQLVVDSSSFADAISALAHVHALATEEYPGVAFRDLAWARLTPWRELSAQFFDASPARPFLDGIHRIQVTYAHGEGGQFNPEQALLYASWLASRLGWEAIPNLRRFGRQAMLIARAGDAPVALEFTARRVPELPAGCLLSTRILAQVDDQDASFAIERAADGAHTVVTTDIQGQRPQERIVPMHEPTVAEVLSDEVSAVRRDHVYDEALAVAIRFASARSGGDR